LPNLAVYSPKESKGTRLIGKFSASDIQDFLTKVTYNKVATNEMSDLKFVKRDCQEYFQQFYSQ